MGQHFVSILYIYIIYKQKDPELISGPLYIVSYLERWNFVSPVYYSVWHGVVNNLKKIFQKIKKTPKGHFYIIIFLMFIHCVHSLPIINYWKRCEAKRSKPWSVAERWTAFTGILRIFDAKLSKNKKIFFI